MAYDACSGWTLFPHQLLALLHCLALHAEPLPCCPAFTPWSSFCFSCYRTLVCAASSVWDALGHIPSSLAPASFRPQHYFFEEVFSDFLPGRSFHHRLLPLLLHCQELYPYSCGYVTTITFPTRLSAPRRQRPVSVHLFLFTCFQRLAQ